MELTEAMRSVGTCRYYRPDPIPDAVLRRAFDAARFGPQGGNRQPVRWLVVRERARKQALQDLYLPMWKASPGARSRTSSPPRPSPSLSSPARRRDPSEMPSVRDGKVRYLNATYDLLGLMKQIGLHRREPSAS